MAKKAYIGISAYERYNLPEGYTQLTYIESTGTQYIDTGVVVKSNVLTMDITAQYMGSAPSATIFYCGFKPSSASTPRASIMIHQNDTFMFGVNSTGTTNATYDNDKHTLKLVGTQTAQRGYIDDKLIYDDTSTNTGFSSNSLSMYLFCRNTDNTADGLMSMRLYSCKLYCDDVIVRSFVPCINQDGVIGLYDGVNGVFYENLGSGNFLAGDIATFDDSVNRLIKKMYLGIEDTYTELEYIQSSGTQYIDTGFVPNQNTRVVMTATYATTSDVSFLFGARSAFQSNDYTFGSYSNSYRSFYGSELLYFSSTLSLTNKFIVDKDKNTTIISCDDTISSVTHTSSVLFEPTGTLNLLSMSDGGKNGQYMASAKIYSCQIYDNDMLVRDYVPVKNSAGDLGLYDRANDKFYGNSGTGTFTAGAALTNKIYVSIAHKVKKAYLGDPDGIAKLVFRGEKDPGSVTISPTSITFNGSTLSKIITVTRLGTGTITAKSSDTNVATVSASGAKVTVSSVNKRSGTATITITVAADDDYLEISITCKVTASFSVSYYGVAANLSETKSELAATTVGDYALFGGGMQLNTTVSTVDSYNKSLTKGYVTPLSSVRYKHAAETVGDYALFVGGYYHVASVDAYTASLTHSTATSLPSGGENMASAKVGNYALFGRGDGTGYNICAYSSSLTQTVLADSYATSGGGVGASLNNYALITGGNNNGYVKVVHAYNSSLTRTNTSSQLTAGTMYSKSASIGDKAIIAGGVTSVSSAYAGANAYNSSLTKLTVSSLSIARTDLAATALGSYMLFGYGDSTAGSGTSQRAGEVNSIDIYNNSLTKTTETQGTARASVAATTVGDYALFGGGDVYTTTGSSIDYNQVNVFTLQ